MVNQGNRRLSFCRGLGFVVFGVYHGAFLFCLPLLFGVEDVRLVPHRGDCRSGRTPNGGEMFLLSVPGIFMS